jgi:sulfide dehydrogenase [flavocytochrome c] flavoprotein subunit
MSAFSRRDFIKGLAAIGGLGLAPLPVNARLFPGGRVVVVGGGYGGATAAKYLRMTDPRIAVTLIEKNKEFVSCALSNEVLAGERDIDSLTFDYTSLANHYGVRVVHDRVIDVDPIKQTVITESGQIHDYDRLIMSPGIRFRTDGIDGYDEAAVESMPHAWKAGPQTVLLRRQLEAMRDGGTVYIVAPRTPYRCPPGPYERASLIAHYLKQEKPKSKVIILDAKNAFPKQALFQQGWDQHYPGMIEWVSAANDGVVTAIDSGTRTLITEFDEHRGDVVNFIPPQEACKIAHRAGLADDTGWCPVDQSTFESRIHHKIHVIGDSCIAGSMPKSGYSANTQAKACAAAVAALLNDNAPPPVSFINTCYSLITPEHGISVSAVYRVVDGRIVPIEGAGGVSPMDATEWERRMEADYARSWFDNIASDIFI